MAKPQWQPTIDTDKANISPLELFGIQTEIVVW